MPSIKISETPPTPEARAEYVRHSLGMDPGPKSDRFRKIVADQIRMAEDHARDEAFKRYEVQTMTEPLPQLRPGIDRLC